jgi:hypothetical protein
LFKNLSTNSLKGGQSNATTFNPHFFSLVFCGSLKVWYGSGSGSSDPYLLLIDPDPDSYPPLFVSDL